MRQKMIDLAARFYACLQILNFLPLLAIRIYLFPIFWMAGVNKWRGMQSTIAWFGNTDWGLGLPYPTLMAYLATVTELLGAICLLFGFATRLISLPLMVVMGVAIMAVHIDHGWLAVAHHSSEAAQRLTGFMQWLEHAHPGRHGFITELGKPVILNNGVEFAVTYLIMLSVLFFYGAGRYFSADHWFSRYWQRRQHRVPPMPNIQSFKRPSPPQDLPPSNMT